MDYNEFVALVDYQRDIIAVDKTYIYLTGDVLTGILLSQIVYWNLPSKKSKIKRSGKFIVKRRKEWYKEICLTPKQYDRCIAKLKKDGLVDYFNRKSPFYPDGAKVPHIELLIDPFMKKLNDLLKQRNDQFSDNSQQTLFPNGENGCSLTGKTLLPDGENVVADKEERSDDLGKTINTELTTELTTKPGEVFNYKEIIQKVWSPKYGKSVHQRLFDTFYNVYPVIYNGEKILLRQPKYQGLLKSIIKNVLEHYTEEESLTVFARKLVLLAEVAIKRNRFQNWSFTPGELSQKWDRLYEGCILGNDSSEKTINDKKEEWEDIISEFDDGGCE